jgi:hypothetical protein
MIQLFRKQLQIRSWRRMQHKNETSVLRSIEMSTLKNITRRNFMASAAAAAVTASTLTSAAKAAGTSQKFKLKYAPSFGMFRQHAGNDPID